MKKIVYLLIFLLLAFALPGHTETENNGPGKNYCREEASWHDWHALLEKNPDDDALHALYALRLGLCSMVESGNMSKDRATSIFENMRESLIESYKERDKRSKEPGKFGI